MVSTDPLASRALRLMAKATLNCANIGYQGRNVEDLCAALRDVGVDTVIDVRESPWSRRPEYRKKALSAALVDNGIAYIHCEEAGNPFRPRDGKRASIEACARQYADHLAANPGIVQIVSDLVRATRTALFCYEAKRHQCHRGLLISALKERHPEMEVIDL